MNSTAMLTALAAACLAALVIFELRPLPAAATDPAASAGIALPANTSEIVPDRTISADTLLGRPLFSQTRHPGAEASPGAAIDAPATPLPRMTGIMIDGTRRSAMFADPAGGKPITVAEGGRVGVFTVESIQPQQVVVLGPEGKRIVHTSFDPTLPAPVVSPLTAPQFPGIVVPGIGALPPPIISPGGRLPGGGPPQFNPQGPTGPAGYGAAR